MYEVKIGKTRNQHGTVQVHITVPYMVARQFPDADKLLIEWDDKEDVMKCYPMTNDELSKEMAIREIEELKAKIEKQFGITYEEMRTNT